MGGAGRRRGVFTVGLTVLAALVLLAGTAAVARRVFRTHDMLTRPTVPYPGVTVITDERPFSELRAAPLVVEGRLRVYAETWRIWADAPVGSRYENTPYWAFRRFPAEVVGVVSVETAQGPYVISQWSDGELVALNARAGSVAWRVNAPPAQAKYDGRRTGASIVYSPRSLLTARSGDRYVVVVTSPGAVHAFDATNGAALWQESVRGGCNPLAWTGSGLLALPACSGTAVTFRAVDSGAPRGTWSPPSPAVPSLCDLGRSECRLVTVGSDTSLLTATPAATFTRVPRIEPHAVLAGDRVVYPTPTGLVARRLTDGAPLWTWTGKGTLLAADSIGVYVMTADRTILGLSPITGRLSVLGCASARPNEVWYLGHIYTTDDDYIALERLTGAPTSRQDSVYYYGPRPIALVELYPPTKLPVWEGKFAACAPQGTRS
jgi:outer membrane protein assembly factor BamB